MRNKIALIGMPGCGKSTIGKLIKDELKLDLIDLDEYIVDIEGKSIEELFLLGEDNFRNAETRALKEAGQKENVIISTGGGIIKKEENSKLLRDNFIVVFIDRPINEIYKDIDSDSRPLLKNNLEALTSLYEERYRLYLKACHVHIINDDSLENTIDKIIKEIKAYRAF